MQNLAEKIKPECNKTTILDIIFNKNTSGVKNVNIIRRMRERSKSLKNNYNFGCVKILLKNAQLRILTP